MGGGEFTVQVRCLGGLVDVSCGCRCWWLGDMHVDQDLYAEGMQTLLAGVVLCFCNYVTGHD